jgi:hypothetical protein
LCLGDYKNHQAETGRYLCNSFDDVVASGVSDKYIYILCKFIERPKQGLRRKKSFRNAAKKA